MDVFFESDRLAKLLQSDRHLKREFGSDNAKSIQRRLENLHIAANLAEMYSLPGEVHQLVGDRDETFTLNLKHGYRLILIPTEQPPPRNAEGGLDLQTIVAVTVLGVENYHDG